MPAIQLWHVETVWRRQPKFSQTPLLVVGAEQCCQIVLTLRPQECRLNIYISLVQVLKFN